MVACNSPDTIICPRLFSIGIWLTVVPGGGLKPVDPPWLWVGTRSIQCSISLWCTPNSCCSAPRVHSAAVC